MIPHPALADLVLSTYHDLDESMIPPGFSLVELIDTGLPSDTQLAIFWSRHSLILAFPGTDSPWDWWTNIAAALRLDRRSGRIRGPRGQRRRFPSKKTMHAWQRRWYEIAPRVRDIAAGEKPDHMAFSGHSLGGVHAVHAAASFYAPGGPDCQLATFGAPRGATADTRATLQGCPAVRYEITLDLVPRVPFLSSQWGTVGERVALAPVVGGIKANHDMGLYRDRVHKLAYTACS